MASMQLRRRRNRSPGDAAFDAGRLSPLRPGFELRIAMRYLRARRKQAFISITTLFTAIGVTIGVAALVVVLSVMGGFEASLRQRILSLTPQIQIQSLTGSITDYAGLEQRVSQLPGITGSDPFIVGQGMATSAH